MPARRQWPLSVDSNPDWHSTPGPTGFNDPEDPNRTINGPQSRSSHGVIRMAEEGAIVLARAGGVKSYRRLRRGRVRILNETNIVGSFPLKGNPWKNDTQKLADMPLDNWFPADREIAIFANQKIPKRNSKFLKTPDVYAFLNALYSNPAKRFNLFTHGTVLSGEVVKGNVIFSSGEKYDLLGAWYYKATSPGFSFQGKGKWRTVQDLHKALPPSAKLIIYGCKSGSNKNDLKRLSKLLGVTVLGFSKSILYRPITSRDGKRIVNWKFSHGKTGKEVDDYHKLNPDMSSK